MSNPVHQPSPSLGAATYTALQGTATPIDPMQYVSLRTEASVNADVLRVREDAAVKHNTFPSWSGHSSGGAHWQTHLHVSAWVRNTTYAKRVWADVHVFAHDGALVSSETCTFEYERPAGDGGDVFVLDCAVYEGAKATPGSAQPRPDARVVQYRLYCQLGDRIHTDGVLHGCRRKADIISP